MFNPPPHCEILCTPMTRTMLVNVRTLDIALLRENLTPATALRYGTRCKGCHSFTCTVWTMPLPPMHAKLVFILTTLRDVRLSLYWYYVRVTAAQGINSCIHPSVPRIQRKVDGPFKLMTRLSNAQCFRYLQSAFYASTPCIGERGKMHSGCTVCRCFSLSVCASMIHFRVGSLSFLFIYIELYSPT